MESPPVIAALPVPLRTSAWEPTTRQALPFVILACPEPGQASVKSLADPAPLVHGARQLALNHHRPVLNAGPEATVKLSVARLIEVVWRVRWGNISHRAVNKNV